VSREETEQAPYLRFLMTSNFIVLEVVRKSCIRFGGLFAAWLLRLRWSVWRSIRSRRPAAGAFVVALATSTGIS